jgi:predicted RNA-binding protein YlxR (DUF448 family)
MRTCTGCRQIAPQCELVRLAFDGKRLVIDPTSRLHNTDPFTKPFERVHRLPGRGAYVHAKVACVTAAGLSRSLRRQVSAADVLRIGSGVTEGDRSGAGQGPRATLAPGNPGGMSPTHDNLGDQLLENAGQNGPGLEDGDTVEMPLRIKAKDDRSEDARL